MVEHAGELLVAIYDDVGGLQGVRVYASRDGARSFVHRATITDPDRVVGLQEPSLVRSASGALVLLCRSTGCGDAIVSSRSFDDGVSWTPLVRHAAKGHPSHAITLADGRALVVYGFRHAPYGVRARIVDAELADIDATDEIVLREDGAGPDLGYPWATQLPDGRVLVVYYWTTSRDSRVIACTILEAG
jgi:hypothetical protein